MLSRLVWAMGTFIGHKATEWNGAGRNELRGLVEGTLSEQRLMQTFTRYASAVLGGGNTGKSRLQRKSAKRLIIIIDGADKVLARDGKSSLRWLPARLPKGLILIMSVTPPEPLQLSPRGKQGHAAPELQQIAKKQRQILKKGMKKLKISYEEMSQEASTATPVLERSAEITGRQRLMQNSERRNHRPTREVEPRRFMSQQERSEMVEEELRRLDERKSSPYKAAMPAASPITSKAALLEGRSTTGKKRARKV